MRDIKKVAEALFNKIRSRFETVILGDENAKSTTAQEDARFFNFEYQTGDHKKLGTVTISIIDQESLKVFYSQSISKNIEGPDKKEWFEFLKELKLFARSNILTFDVRDISRPGLSIRDIKQIAKDGSTFNKDDVMAESRMWGSSRSSYQDVGPARIIVRHSCAVNPEIPGGRTRNVGSVFVETQEGERFKLPECYNKKLLGARAMARHISKGGAMNDDLGQHITEMVNEMSALTIFVRNGKNKVFEDGEAQAMLEAAMERYMDLHKSLRCVSGNRGYNRYKDDFKPESVIMDDVDVDQLKEKFVKKLFDDRITPALEYAFKAYKRKQQLNDSYLKEFEDWANNITEGTWVLPETEEQIKQLNDLLSKELKAGINGSIANDALEKIIGDDDLSDLIYKTASTAGKDQDVRKVVVGWIEKNHPDLMSKLSIPDELKDGEETENQPAKQEPAPAAPEGGAAPDAAVQAQQPAQPGAEAGAEPGAEAEQPPVVEGSFENPVDDHGPVCDILDKNDIEYELHNGKYYLYSDEEIGRAKDLLAAAHIPAPKFGIKKYEPTDFGTTGSDSKFRVIEDLRKLAGLK